MSHSINRSLRLVLFRPALIAMVALFAFAPAAEAQNEALLRLLQVLRDRGSITAQEYEEIRKVAESPQIAAPAGQLGAVEKRVAEQEKTVAAIKAQTDGNPPPVVSRALAGKWYERIGLRGYTQFRGSNVFDHEGPPLEVANDRSVNETETLIIRRGRFVFSGDVTDRLSLYAQSDFNGSTGAADFSLQMRDLYADIWLDKAKFFRVRAGQSKIPFGWVNMQSSQNRAPLERPDGINSGAESERDYGATFMWTPAAAKQAFRDITALGLKGTGDYGLVAVGVYGGQGPNRSDQNGQTHVLGRVAYPFKLASGQFVEVGVQAYHGRFVTTLQSIAPGGGASITPTQDADGELDQRVGFTAVWYPQPIGVEAEWNFGRGPELSADNTRIESESLHGGYVQVNYRTQRSSGAWFPFTRWNYYDGARKFARNAPPTRVNEVDIGLEFAKWAEVELTGMYTHTFKRTRTGSFPYTDTLNANRVGLQLQWNY
jgi:Phosphate-selective porin O and P